MNFLTYFSLANGRNGKPVHTGTNDRQQESQTVHSTVTTLLKQSFVTFSNKKWAMHCQNSSTHYTFSGTRQIHHQTWTQGNVVMK